LRIRPTRLDDPRDLTEASNGIRTVFIAMGSIGIEGVLQRIAMNAAAGISSIDQVIRLSVLNTSAASLGINQRAHYSVDQFASSTALPYSTIRRAIFSASLLAAGREVRDSRAWTGFAGSGRMALIDHRDAAEAGLRCSPTWRRRTRPREKLDVAGRVRLAASVAVEVGADVPAAAGVDREFGRAAGCGVVAVAPLHQYEEGGGELASLVGEDVLRSAGTFRIWNALQHVLVAEQLQPVGEHVGGDPETRLEFLEPLHPGEGVAQDQQRPALPNHLERPRYRAHLVWIVAMKHDTDVSWLA
jgi:hypothetical protein